MEAGFYKTLNVKMVLSRLDSVLLNAFYIFFFFGITHKRRLQIRLNFKQKLMLFSFGFNHPLCLRSLVEANAAQRGCSKLGISLIRLPADLIHIPAHLPSQITHLVNWK